MTESRPAAPSLLSRAPTAGDLVAGVIVSLVGISFYLSSATLMFQGPLLPHLPLAIGAALLSGALLSFLGAARCSQPLASMGPEPATVPVIAGVTAGVAAGTSPGAALPTALAALGVTALAIGAAWWLIGRRGAGNLIRFIPYPVIGGFLSAVGWLLVSGGIAVSTGVPLGSAPLEALAAPGVRERLLAGLGFGALLWLGGTRIRHMLFLPGTLLLLSLAVHAGLAWSGIDLQAARSQGWLMVPFQQAMPTSPLDPQVLARAEWSVVLAQWGLILSAVIVSAIGLLLSVSSLEVAFDARADVNRDLRVLGLGNIAGGLLGALAGGISISRSVANQAAGARSAWSGVIKGLVCLVLMFWGGPAIALVPKAVLGGLLISIGLAMLKTWLVDSRSRLSTGDFMTVVVMVAVTACFGFLPAVFVGIVSCSLDFALSSARIAPVRRQLTRSAWPARIEYSPAQLEAVIAAGRELLIVELQGVLFFGSVTRLVEQIEQRLGDTEPPRALLLDFQQVPWVDSSAAQALARLVKQAQAQGVTVDFSQLAAPVARSLDANGCKPTGADTAFRDIDAAVADWDARFLARSQTPAGVLEDGLALELGDHASAAALLARFETLELAAGDVLFAQGDPPDALYFVREGRLVASVAVGTARIEVRTVLAGSALGEMGLFRQTPRSATLTAAQPSRVLRLHRDRLRALESEAPALASALYRLLIRQLASRLDQANAQTHALSR